MVTQSKKDLLQFVCVVALIGALFLIMFPVITTDRDFDTATGQIRATVKFCGVAVSQQIENSLIGKWLDTPLNVSVTRSWRRFHTSAGRVDYRYGAILSTVLGVGEVADLHDLTADEKRTVATRFLAALTGERPPLLGWREDAIIIETEDAGEVILWSESERAPKPDR